MSLTGFAFSLAAAVCAKKLSEDGTLRVFFLIGSAICSELISEHLITADFFELFFSGPFLEKSQKMADLGVCAKTVLTRLCGQFGKHRLLQKTLR